MLIVSTYVAPSAIEGLGVFASEFIERGRLFWSLNPKFDIFIQQSEIQGFPPHMQDFVARYGYPHLEMPGVVIVDSDNGRFMNHSDQPNTDFRIFDKGYALVDIAPGTRSPATISSSIQPLPAFSPTYRLPCRRPGFTPVAGSRIRFGLPQAWLWLRRHRMEPRDFRIC